MRIVPRRRKDRRKDRGSPGSTGPGDGTAGPAAERGAPAGESAAGEGEAGESAVGTLTLETPRPSEEERAEQLRRHRARAAERQRVAAEVKRSRAEQRRSRGKREKRVREFRSSLLVMVITLGLLIATVAVTGAMIAATSSSKPIALAAPLHIYPVGRVVPGQCPPGTRGITGQTSSGLTCYQLSQGIAIREVEDLEVQKGGSGGDYNVAITLRESDRKAFATLTRATVDRSLAFVVRNQLVTVPQVEAPITDGKVAINGPNRGEAERMVRTLRGS